MPRPGQQVKMRFFALLFLLILLSGALFSSSRAGRQDAGTQKARIGHTGDPITGFLFAAAETPEWKEDFTLVKFSSSSDIGYALLSGKLGAGFIKPEKLALLLKLKGSEKLKVIGKAVFPYGAVVVLRKGVNARLSELGGLKIAFSSDSCKLAESFEKDAVRLGADISEIERIYLPFEAMIPALQSKEIDGAVMKGSYSQFAKKLGHGILYQKWDLKAGDECCPEALAMLEYVLVAGGDESFGADKLVGMLKKASGLEPVEQRGASARKTGIKAADIEGMPVAEFLSADDGILKLIESHAHD